MNKEPSYYLHQLKVNIYGISYIPDELKKDINFILKVIKSNPASILMSKSAKKTKN